MAIKVNTGFEVNTAQPIDLRIVADTAIDRNAIPSTWRYEGLDVYVVADQQEYRLVGGIADINWIKWPITSSYADTASFALNGGSLTAGTQSIFATQSLFSTQSIYASQSLFATQSIYSTQSLFSTQSTYATESITASYITASGVLGTVASASWALTASFALNGGGGGGSSSIAYSASNGMLALNGNLWGYIPWFSAGGHMSASMLSVTNGGSIKAFASALTNPPLGGTLYIGRDNNPNTWAALSLYNSAGGTDAKYWVEYADQANQLNFMAASDDFSIQNTWLRVTRTGPSVTQILFNRPITIAGNVLPANDMSHSLGTGSLRWANAFINTMYGTASWATQSLTASAINFVPRTAGSASYASQSFTASLAIYALNAGTASIVTGNITDANQAISASFASASISSSYVATASIATSASNAQFSNLARSASYASASSVAYSMSGSGVLGAVTSSLTASLAQTASSLSFTPLSVTSASYASSSLNASHSLVADSASYAFSASHANQSDDSLRAISASYAPVSGVVTNAETASWAKSASLADSASNAIESGHLTEYPNTATGVTELFLSESLSLVGNVLPASRSLMIPAVVGNTIYLYGGWDSNLRVASIYTASLSDPTTVGDSGMSLPAAVSNTSVLISGSKMFMIGGYDGNFVLNTIRTASTADPLTWNAVGTFPTNVFGQYMFLSGSTMWAFLGTSTITNTWVTAAYTASTSNPAVWGLAGTLPFGHQGGHLFAIDDKLYLYFGYNSLNPLTASLNYNSMVMTASVSNLLKWGTASISQSIRTDERSMVAIGYKLYDVGGNIPGIGPTYTNLIAEISASAPITASTYGKTTPAGVGTIWSETGIVTSWSGSYSYVLYGGQAQFGNWTQIITASISTRPNYRGVVYDYSKNPSWKVLGNSYFGSGSLFYQMTSSWASASQVSISSSYSFTASYANTASEAKHAETASYSNYAQSASVVLGNITDANQAISCSAASASISASYAFTASAADSITFVPRTALSASWVTSSVSASYAISASTAYPWALNVKGDTYTQTTRVGIGITDPVSASRLEVYEPNVNFISQSVAIFRGNRNDGNAMQIVVRNENAGASAYSALFLGLGAVGGIEGSAIFTTRAATPSFGIVNGLNFTPNQSSQDIGFRVGNAISGTVSGPTVQIKSTGIIGMGVATPSAARLHLGGSDIALYSALIRMTNGATGGGDTFMGSTDNAWIPNGISGSRFVIGSGDPSSFGVYRLFIEHTTGRVAIGAVTGSAQGALHVQGLITASYISASQFIGTASLATSASLAIFAPTASFAITASGMTPTPTGYTLSQIAQRNWVSTSNAGGLPSPWPSSSQDMEPFVVNNVGYMFASTNSVWTSSTSDMTQWGNSNYPAPVLNTSVLQIGNKLYAFGGNMGGYYTSSIFTASVSNPLVWADSGVSLPVALGWSQVVSDGTKLYMMGGWNGTGSMANSLQTASISDPLTWNSVPVTWSTLANTGSLPYNSQNWVIGNKIYMIGGFSASINVTADENRSVWTASVTNPSIWGEASPRPSYRFGFASSIIVGNYLIILGGYHDNVILSSTFTASLDNPHIIGDSGFVIPYTTIHHSSMVYGANAYLFGGYNGSYTNKVCTASINSLGIVTTNVFSQSVLNNPSWKIYGNIWTISQTPTTSSWAVNASTSSMTQTASLAAFAISAAYAPGSSTLTASNADTASFAFNAFSASYAPSAPSISASYALTASFSLNGGGGGAATSASWASSSLTASSFIFNSASAAWRIYVDVSNGDLVFNYS